MLGAAYLLPRWIAAFRTMKRMADHVNAEAGALVGRFPWMSTLFVAVTGVFLLLQPNTIEMFKDFGMGKSRYTYHYNRSMLRSLSENRCPGANMEFDKVPITKIPRTISGPLIDSDSTGYTNRDIAKYFGLATVRTKNDCQ